MTTTNPYAEIFIWLGFTQVLCMLLQPLNSFVQLHCCIWTTCFVVVIPFSHPAFSIDTLALESG